MFILYMRRWFFVPKLLINIFLKSVVLYYSWIEIVFWHLILTFVICYYLYLQFDSYIWFFWNIILSNLLLIKIKKILLTRLECFKRLECVLELSHSIIMPTGKEWKHDNSSVFFNFQKESTAATIYTGEIRNCDPCYKINLLLLLVAFWFFNFWDGDKLFIKNWVALDYIKWT